MTAVVILLIAAGAVLLGIAAGYWLPPNGRLPSRDRPRAVRRILLPFTGQAISRRSFEAAVRLAKAENAIIMPAFLARVPMNLPLASPLPVQCARGMPLLEAIEQRIASQGLPVESRISRGRSARDALHKLLERAPAEILILRPAPEDTRRISAEAGAGAVGRAPRRS